MTLTYHSDVESRTEFILKGSDCDHLTCVYMNRFSLMTRNMTKIESLGKHRT